jgi:small conductance mechanosensitive channel
MWNLIPVALAASSDTETSTFFPDVFAQIVLGVIAFAVTYVLAVLFRTWIKRVIRKKQGDKHEEAQILYGRMAFAITFGVGAMIALTIMGVPLEWFSGGIGLGVAYALRNFIANFFAGVVLLSNTKYNLGDFVILDENTMGKIVDIQSRATSLRAIDGGEITIPNLKMLEANVKCYAKNPIRRHSIEMSIGYGSNIKAASELIKKTVEANENVQPMPEVTVLIKEVADSALILEARFWTESQIKWWFVKSELTRMVFEALVAADIDIPYPIQTLRVDEASSDLLARDPHFLEKLEKIESEKQVALQKVFTPAPQNK